MTTDLARREQPTQALAQMTSEQLQYISNTDFIPKAMRGNLPAILACVATGRSLGLSDMHALRSINIIDGKATMSAELMVALVRQRGHSIAFEQGDGFAKATGVRADNGDTMTVVWTMEMAKRADLLRTDKKNWMKHPETMLTWRAGSQLCRFLFPDCLAGVSHIPDEVELTPEERIDAAIGEARPPQDAGPVDDLGVIEPPPAEGAQGSVFEQMAQEATSRKPPE